MPDELKQRLRENISGPHQVVVDGTQTTQHSLREQIEAVRFLASEEAAGKGRLGVRMHRARAPGGGGV